MAMGLGVLAWSPLAGGKLADTDDLPTELATVLKTLAEREQASVATLALSFVLAHPARPIAIIGTTMPERIIEASRALEVKLDRTDVYQIIQASMGQPLP